MEKENSEFKPVKLRLKIDLVSHPVYAEELVNRNKKARETAETTFSAYCQGVNTNCQVRIWFSKFCSGNMALRNETKSGRTSDFEEDALGELVE